MPHTLFPRADAVTKARLESDEMVRLADNFDWPETELGPIREWPEALRAAVRLVLVSDVPMVMMAGARDGVLIYNSGYAMFAGDRHPGIFGRPVLDAWPEIADFNRENMRRGFTGESWYLADQELVLNRRGRFEPAWMNLNYSPVLDDAGAVLAVLVVVIETTDRVITQRDLARNREKLEMALQSSAMVGTWDWDLRNDKVTADERFARLFSVDPAAAAEGMPIAEYLRAIHPDDRARVQAEIEYGLAHPGHIGFEYRLVQSDGSIRYVSASGEVMVGSDSKPTRFPGVVVDITEQRLAAEALAESEMRFRTLADTMPQMVWSTLPDGYHDYYNARWYEFTGVPVGTTDGEGWNDMFHPDDQQRAWAEWRHSLTTGEPYHIEYRLRHHSGSYRWVLGQALPIRDSVGRITRWFGTCTDIHETRLAAEEREIIAQELSHRIKNIFAVLGGLVGLVGRQHPDAARFADALRDRIFALGRAHDFVRPHSKASAPRSHPATLQSLIGELLTPYMGEGQDRVVFEGEDVSIDDAAATPLALLFHELATNAAKYGALGRSDGRLVISTGTDGDNVTIQWREHGGPAPAAAQTSGFGSRLIAMSVEGQLRGQLKKHWEDDGLVVDVSVPASALMRPRATPAAPVPQTPVTQGPETA
jgi:PAS domain S-box-containing protein